MAVHKLYNAYITINSVDLSDHVKSITLNTGAESLDATKMSDTTRNFIGGLLTASLTVDFEQDYASSKVDATVAAVGLGASTTIVIRPDAGSVGTTNPQWSGSWVLTSYQPVGGTVGDLHMTQLQCVPAGTITRATA